MLIQKPSVDTILQVYGNHYGNETKISSTTLVKIVKIKELLILIVSTFSSISFLPLLRPEVSSPCMVHQPSKQNNSFLR